MSKLTLIIFLIFCVGLVVFPLWGASKGYGESSVKTERDKKTGTVRYVGSRISRGGGTSSGK